MAYVEMFGRDLSRVRDAIERIDESPLGAAALAGTGFPIDRHMTAKALGFREPTRNSLDSVSDRDYALNSCRLPQSAPGIFRALPKRRHLVHAAVQFRAPFRRLLHRLLDHAAEEEPGRRRTGTRQDGPHQWFRSDRILSHHEGPAASLFKDMLGRQGNRSSTLPKIWNWRLPRWLEWCAISPSMSQP